MIVPRAKQKAYERRITAYVKRNPDMTAADVNRRLHISYVFAKKLLERLVDRKILRRKKISDRTVYY